VSAQEGRVGLGEGLFNGGGRLLALRSGRRCLGIDMLLRIKLGEDLDPALGFGTTAFASADAFFEWAGGLQT
jgi:hypothetical protein